MVDVVRFVLDGELIEIENVDPTRSVLSYLRAELGRTGTKEGCAEGDCGACTVVIGELDDGRLRTRTVNSCIQFVPTLDGKALFTVESLRGDGVDLHPAQQALVDCHGSQCGFCTPGFVMSLWNEYNRFLALGRRPDRHELATSLSGNLCRCTGYRPIVEAAQKMFDLPPRRFDDAALVAQLGRLARPQRLRLRYRTAGFDAPRSLDELVRLRSAKPDATLLAGGTDIGVWVNKQLRGLGDIIYLGEVAALQRIETQDGRLSIGAGVNLSDAYAALAVHYPQLQEIWERFASVPIRNAGTLGGNVANGSPIGDSMPWLIALDAQVVLIGRHGSRTIPIETLYVDYLRKSMAADELVQALLIPLPTADLHFRSYKLSKRYDSDISAVCAAFALRLDGERIRQARVAYGGMAAIPKRAANCESLLTGQVWNEATARAAMRALGADFAPLDDLRASAAYRARTAANLLYRFFLQTRPLDPLSSEQTQICATIQAAS